MTVLPDTSIWIDFFRDREPTAGTLDRLLRERAVVLCGPILAELLAGTPEEQRESLRLALGGLPIAAVDYAAWREAGECAYALRRRGVSIPLLDILIAAVAVRAEAALWTRDRDFERIREVLPTLELYEPGIRGADAGELGRPVPPT